MQDLKSKIQESIKKAMKSQDKHCLATLRMISAAIKQQEVDKRIELTEENIISILIKMIKQRKESISHFKSAGREDLVLQEKLEMDVINEFLPQQLQLSEEEIIAAVKAGVIEVGASSIKDMSKVMRHLRQTLVGVIDFEMVGTLVKDILLSNNSSSS